MRLNVRVQYRRSVMALKSALKHKRTACLAILTVSLTLVSLATFLSVKRKKLSLQDVMNPPVRVSLGTYQQSQVAAAESYNTSAVPNVVHYVWLGDDLSFTFINYLSFKSVDRFIQPRFILVYGEAVPTGVWWTRVVSEILNVYHVHMNAPEFAPNGKRYKYPAHKSDFVRFSLLSLLGGIYLDSDVLVLRSFDTLRQYSMVLGREQPEALCNGIIVARRGAPFLQMILDLYDSYLGENEDWGYRANRIPHQLALQHPELIHVEETSLDRPNWKESPLIYNGRYNWTSNFAMHLWVRKWPERYLPRGLEDIATANTTMGEMSRWILYGFSEPLSSLSL